MAGSIATSFGRTSSDSSSSDSVEERQTVEVQEKAVATYVARMEVLTPDVVRVTRAYNAFRGCGKALRPQNHEDLHKDSFVRERISSFWSHSWHGPCWRKILSLFMRYNGLAAVLIGCSSASECAWHE
ncbi:unnamed protein product [Durusdinium trenchii]|uniref:Uncharacterized protein n=1 Tax=Durusdinium trenchii TaxID=1381693 RepID=A0ABP0J1T2_9DINO